MHLCRCIDFSSSALDDPLFVRHKYFMFWDAIRQSTCNPSCNGWWWCSTRRNMFFIKFSSGNSIWLFTYIDFQFLPCIIVIVVIIINVSRGLFCDCFQLDTNKIVFYMLFIQSLWKSSSLLCFGNLFFVLEQFQGMENISKKKLFWSNFTKLKKCRQIQR